MKTNAGDIAARLGGSLHGDPATPIHGVGTLQDGQPGEIGFLAENHYRKYLTDTTLSASIRSRTSLASKSSNSPLSSSAKPALKRR